MKIKNVHGNTLDLPGEAIVAGQYAAGAVLPSEPLLCGQLGASHNRMMMQMSEALGAVLRVSFELSTLKSDRAGKSLPQHRAVLDAVIAGDPKKAESAILVLIDVAGREVERMLSSRRKLPSLIARPD